MSKTRLAILLLTLFPHSPAAAGIGLYPAGTIVLAKTPSDLKSGNVGGAGTDLFIADQPGNDIRWLRNDGNGNFPTVAHLPESAPIAIELADVNNDGRLDLLSGNWGDSQVSVRLHTGGEPAYDQAAMRFPMGTRNVRDLVVVDLDGDGVKDLAAINSDARCYIRKGNGDGTFGPSKFISGGTAPKAIAAGDLGGDGRVDLVIVDYGSNRLRINRNTGNLNFAIAVPVEPGEHPNDAVVRDYDGDGDLDIAVANENGTVAILVNDGTGVFGEKRTIPVGPLSQTLLADDFDGDGDLDLAVPSSSNQSLAVFLNSGAGTFDFETATWINRDARRVAALDLNGDGRLDFVVANEDSWSGSSALTFFDNLAAPPSSIGPCGLPTLTTAPGAGQVIVPDLDGDGDADLATANSSGSVSYWLRQPGGDFGPRVDLPSGVGTASVAAGDVDRDGRVDLVAANKEENDLTVWRNTGGGFFTRTAVLPVGMHPRFVKIADLDGDGRPDLATVNEGAPGGDGSVTILFNPPGANWAPVAEPVLGQDALPAEATVLQAGGDPFVTGNLRVDFAVGPRPTMLDVGDANVDGFVDLVVGNDAGLPISIVQGLGHGRFSPPRRLEISGSFVLLSDYWNVGPEVDLAVADGGASCVRIAPNYRVGNNPFWSVTSIPIGPTPTAIAVRDVNGSPHFVYLSQAGLLGEVSYVFDEVSYGFAVGPDPTCALGDDAPSLAIALLQDGSSEVFAVVRGANAIARRKYAPFVFDASARAPASGEATAPAFGLEPPSPNPSARGAAIAFTLPARARVRLGVYDVRGRLVRALWDGDLDAGRRTVAWDGADASGARVAAGIYFYCLVSPLGTRTARQVMVGGLAP